MTEDSTLYRTFCLQKIYADMFESYVRRGYNKELDQTDSENQFDQPWKLNHYYDVGADALKCILNGLITGLKQPPTKILDLPSGSGRVTRHLTSFFPEAKVVACDLYEAHVDFCREALKVEAVVSKPDLDDLDLGMKFDVIFCGSLLTHFPMKTFASALRFFSRTLSDDGIAVVSLHGRHVEFAQKNKYGIIQQELFDIAARQVNQTGFGYVDYAHDLMSTAWDKNENYGITLSRPSVTMKLLEEDYGIRILNYTERAWDCGQDVVVFGRPGVNFPMRPGDVDNVDAIKAWKGVVLD